jgi:hypothetical protein
MCILTPDLLLRNGMVLFTIDWQSAILYVNHIYKKNVSGACDDAVFPRSFDHLLFWGSKYVRNPEVKLE